MAKAQGAVACGARAEGIPSCVTISSCPPRLSSPPKVQSSYIHAPSPITEADGTCHSKSLEIYNNWNRNCSSVRHTIPCRSMLVGLSVSSASVNTHLVSVVEPQPLQLAMSFCHCTVVQCLSEWHCMLGVIVNIACWVMTAWSYSGEDCSVQGSRAVVCSCQTAPEAAAGSQGTAGVTASRTPHLFYAQCPRLLSASAGITWLFWNLVAVYYLFLAHAMVTMVQLLLTVQRHLSICHSSMFKKVCL